MCSTSNFLISGRYWLFQTCLLNSNRNDLVIHKMYIQNSDKVSSECRCLLITKNFTKYFFYLLLNKWKHLFHSLPQNSRSSLHESIEHTDETMVNHNHSQPLFKKIKWTQVTRDVTKLGVIVLELNKYGSSKSKLIITRNLTLHNVRFYLK